MLSGQLDTLVSSSHNDEHLSPLSARCAQRRKEEKHAFFLFKVKIKLFQATLDDTLYVGVCGRVWAHIKRCIGEWKCGDSKGLKAECLFTECRLQC